MYPSLPYFCKLADTTYYIKINLPAVVCTMLSCFAFARVFQLRYPATATKHMIVDLDLLDSI